MFRDMVVAIGYLAYAVYILGFLGLVAGLVLMGNGYL